ncbi:hypothetical protein FA15DRAFT_654050 [Coprinopsis marcescibilis]|uniref:Uncharacterized protein n=1 Tax=Coprinopsis marcescibilis TaxID=230819 RepID=A0A5C3L3X7_COPMA|nr:hypothetical protein FA15DRAFT_654050 [Coprinopsis marcescibilis]
MVMALGSSMAMRKVKVIIRFLKKGTSSYSSSSFVVVLTLEPQLSERVTLKEGNIEIRRIFREYFVGREDEGAAQRYGHPVQKSRECFMHFRCVRRMWRRADFETPTFRRGLVLPDSGPKLHIAVVAEWLDRGGVDAPTTLHCAGNYSKLFAKLRWRRRWQEIELVHEGNEQGDNGGIAAVLSAVVDSRFFKAGSIPV